MLFINVSSALNTILPGKLLTKLLDSNLNTSLCNWVLDFLNHKPSIRFGKHQSTLIISTGAPQGCVLTPMLYTRHCLSSPSYPSNNIIKFADDATMLGITLNNNAAAYRREEQNLSVWCHNHNLSLNSKKTMEVTEDFQRSGQKVERLTNLFLGVTVMKELSWDATQPL